MKRVNLVICTTSLGVPTSLASTAFIGALAEGLNEVGGTAHVISLMTQAGHWHPEALGSVDASAPWTEAPPPTFLNLLDALRKGVFDDGVHTAAEYALSDEWYRELLLQREFERLSDGSRDGVAMVYERSYPILKAVSRVCDRLGWRLMVFATEALTANQIDPETRNEYVRLVVQRADGIWAVSTHLAEYWAAQGFPAERIWTSPSIVRKGFFLTDVVQPQSTTAVYLGNLVHREIEYLLQIVRFVLRVSPEFHLDIYGDATEDRRDQLVMAIEDMDLADAVRLHEAIALNEIPAVLKKATVLLLPRARGEFSDAGFPNKVGEYLSSGRPVVVTAVGDIPDYLADRETAFIVEPDDCDAFARAVVEVLSEPEIGDEVGARGRRLAEELLRSDRVACRAMSFIAALGSRAPAIGQAEGPGVWIGRSDQLLAFAIPPTKRVIVRILRLLRLKPPAPESER